MTGKYLAELMNNSKLKHAISKHARRYSSRVEDQEEYIQDAWLRISKQEEGCSIDHYAEAGRKSIISAYWRKRRNDVSKDTPRNANGNSIREIRDPRKYVELERGKYIVRQVEVLDSWYYDGEWNDWVIVENHKEWFRRSDAEHHELYPFYTIDKSYSKKYRVNNIEVT